MTGTGLGGQYLRYRGFAHKDRLRHVFYVHFFNDFADLRRTGLFALSATGGLVRRMRRPTTGWIRFLSGLRLTYLVVDVWQRLADPEQAPHERDFVFEALLSRWRDEAEANGSAFHVVLLPRSHTKATFRRRVEAELFDVLDLRVCFAAEIPGYVWEDWTFRSDPHWSEAGHMVAAHCIYRFLESRLGIEGASDEALARARHVYYRAFADDAGWQGHRFMPSAPWASPAPADAAEAARIRAKHLALESDSEDQRHRIAHEVRQGQPLVRRGGWNVYPSPRHRVVVFVKAPCGDGEEETGRLFLQASPVNKGELRAGEPRAQKTGFMRVPHRRRRHAASWRDGRDCVVAWPVGPSVYAKLRVGEYGRRRGDAVLWEAEFPFHSAEQVAAATAAYRRDYDAFAKAARGANSHWNIRVLGGRVAFLKASCGAGDRRGVFFLRMYPADARDAAGELTSGGFVLRVLGFGTDAVVSAVRVDDKCLVSRMLPEWPVTTISAGQMIGEAVLWETTFHLDVERFRRAWADVRSKAPTGRGDFDVYRRGTELVYVRERCTEEDAAARFFLHVFAGATRANLDFHFNERGVVFDGRCVAVARLPTQDIDRIHTGQFVAGGGTLWSVEI